MSRQVSDKLLFEYEGKKKKHKKGKVYPTSDAEQWYNNAVFDEKEETANESSALEKFKIVAEKANNNPINVISNVKTGVVRWKKYVTSRRRALRSEAEKGIFGNKKITKRTTGGGTLDNEVRDDFRSDGTAQLQMVVACNRNLIQYFAKLGKTESEDESIDLEFVDSLLKSGANINCTDKYGQALLHEVARAWHVDVAKFLIENGANINQGDNFGRTPLHVAAAVDYPEMVNFLIENGADKEARTSGENQTPIHFAARNDACQSLKALMKKGCQYKDVRDYKGRTPLHVAAELDRSETARMLLECDDPAPAGVVDDSGQSAIVWMITKMAPVAKLALDQLHTTDRANRKQYYHLQHLETKKPNEPVESSAQTALQVIVSYKQYDLITHPAVSELISIKWVKFGKLGAWISLIVNLLFILFWTAIGIVNAILGEQGTSYNLPDAWWRIFLYVIAVLLTLWQIKEELTEYYYSRKAHSRRKKWREAEIDRDLQYAHKRWPEEQEFLLQEKNELDKQKPQYFNDFWNIFDWLCYTLLLICLGLHIADIFSSNTTLTRVQLRLMALTVILMWLRLMKYARAFSFLGPFIVMLGHMVGDVARFGFLYLEFYIPFACAFWMIYGGQKIPTEYWGRPDAQNYTMTVSGYEDVGALLFSMFRLTLVDEYDYDGMKAVDPDMAYVLLISWFLLSAILCLNLFIALMSDTFQRVYDNAKANAVMQKAITILGIEEGMGKRRRDKFRAYIHSNCAPKENYYDDDATESTDEDLKKVTIQIKVQLDELQEQMDSVLFRKSNNNATKTNPSLREDLDELKETIEYEMRSRSTESQSESDKKDRGKQLTAEALEKEVDILREEIAEMRDYQEDVLEELSKNMETVLQILQQFSPSQPRHPFMPRGGDPLMPLAPLVPRTSTDARIPQRHPASREMSASLQRRSRSTDQAGQSEDTLTTQLHSDYDSNVVPPLTEISVAYSAGQVQPPDNATGLEDSPDVRIRRVGSDSRHYGSEC